MKEDLFQQFEHGTLVHGGQQTQLEPVAWNRHKDFAGVFLKNVVTAAHTNGLFTCHLVRIDPGCTIGLHTHPTSIEIHEVLRGNGVCLTDEGKISYTPGTIAILAHNAPHEVQAGSDGLCLFAKFITVPA